MTEPPGRHSVSGPRGYRVEPTADRFIRCLGRDLLMPVERMVAGRSVAATA